MCFSGFDLEIGFSQNFHFKPFLDSRVKREREREKSLRLCRRTQSLNHATNPEPRSRLRLRRSTNLRTDLWPRAFNPPIYEPTNWSSTQSLRPTSLRLRQWPRAFAPRTHELFSLSVWFWFFVWFWSTHEPIYVSMWFWFFTFSLWSLIFFFFVVVVVWVVVFWWFSCCVVVGFVWVVVESSIFRMLPNTWKYFLEQFS